MKKTSLVLLSALLSSTLVAEVAASKSLYSPKNTHQTTCCMVSLATPLQLPSADECVKGLRWNIVYGESYGVTGFDLGLAGLNCDQFAGGAVYGLGTWTDGDATGVQLSGLSTIVCGNATGFQLSGLVNFNRGEFAGFQVAPFNLDGSFCGFEIGALNLENGVGSGLKLGAANANTSEFTGVSLGAFNFANRLYGCQVGVLNIAAESGRGVQIGVVNSAAVFKGVQIGALNLIGNGAIPVMPVLNARF